MSISETLRKIHENAVKMMLITKIKDEDDLIFRDKSIKQLYINYIPEDEDETQTSDDDTPTSDTPTSDTPTSDTPTSDTPTSDDETETSDDETPTSETPTSETPTSDDETPTSDDETQTNDELRERLVDRTDPFSSAIGFGRNRQRGGRFQYQWLYQK